MIEGVVLAGLAHDGAEHLIGGRVLLVAFGHQAVEPQFIQRPVRQAAKGLGPVAMAGKFRQDAAAQLSGALVVEVVQHRLTDELSIQTDGEVHRQLALEILLGHPVEVILRQLPLQVLAVVVAPPAVARVIQAQAVIGGDVGAGDGVHGEPLALEGGDAVQIPEIGGYRDTVLAAHVRGQVLGLAGAKALVGAVILPVDPKAVLSIVGGKGLHHGGIDPLIARKGLLDVADQSASADLPQGDGDEFSLQLQRTGQHPGFPNLAGQLPGVAQLLFCHGVFLVEGQVKLVPKGLQLFAVGFGDGTKDSGGIELVEFIDVVALAGVPAAGKGGEILGVVQVVLPGAAVGDGGIGVAMEQYRQGILRHGLKGGEDAIGAAVVVNLVQGGIQVGAVVQGHRVIEGSTAVVGIADNETAIGFRKAGVHVVAPHELDTHRVFTQPVGTIFVILAKSRTAFYIDWFEDQHKMKSLLFFLGLG